MFSTDFISATKEYCTVFDHVPAPYMRKTFSIEKPLARAKITICGLGFYDLFINGTRITKGLIAPYISNPDQILFYDEYDLTERLKNGKNALGIMLGNGMQNCMGGAIWYMKIARYLSAPKVALALELTYADGETACFHADETFKVHPSPIRFDDLRMGEFYDANFEIDGWNLPDFDDTSWKNAIKVEAPRGECRLCTAEPIVIKKRLTPVSITPNKRVIFDEDFFPEPMEEEFGQQIPLEEEYRTGYLYDFGENLAGNIRLRIKGEKGQTVSILHGELLTENGDMDDRNMKFQPLKYEHRIVYTLKGDGVEEYAPTFTYQGFRYCLVAGITEDQATEDLLTYEVMSSDLQKNGDFSCSDEVANKLQRATYNANISNFYYFPTDCPHREKNGWTADAALSAEQMLFNLTPENSYRVWLDNIRKAQRIDGALPCVVPTSGYYGFEWGNGPAWDCVLFYLPYYTWLQRGDTDIIRENATAMMHYLQYVSTRRDGKGLLHIGLGDWLPIEYKNPITPLEVTDTLVTMNICRLAATMFEAIGMQIQKQFALGLFDELRTAARAQLLDAATVTVRGRTQTAQCMAIEYGLLNDAEQEKAFQVLLDIINEADGHLDTGCLGARIIFHVLAKRGYAELAYNMIVRPDYPSYGHWVVHEDCTALFEAFQKETDMPNSKNHHFFGDISSWFFKYVTGVKINPDATDAKKIEISPNFISTLTHAEGYQYHMGGKLECAWRQTETGYTLTVALPKTCHGTLVLPHGYALENGEERTALTTGTTEYTVHRI